MALSAPAIELRPRAGVPRDPMKHQLSTSPSMSRPRGQGGPYLGGDPTTWRPKGFEVGFIVPNEHGLADIIRGGKEALPGYFEPTEVDGYPAVFNDLVDGRTRGICQITVGISDTLAFRAAEQSSREVGVKACDNAKQLAAAVIQTLKEG